jgi:hypothetical protein
VVFAMVSGAFFSTCRLSLSLLRVPSCGLKVDIVTVRDKGSPLFGELDVVANRNITVGELGPYAGVLLRDDEVLSHLAQKPRAFLRAMHFWYSVLFDGAHGGGDDGLYGQGASKTAALQGTFSLFPFAGNAMAVVNDFAGPNRSEQHKATCAPPNCKYQVVKANGWPYVFVMATRPIAEGESLRADYGDAFWDTWREVVAVEKCVDEASRALFETIAGLGAVADLPRSALRALA